MASPEASTYLSRQDARGAAQREAVAAGKLAAAEERVERAAALRIAGLSTAAEQAELLSRAAAEKAAKKAALKAKREERRAGGGAGGGFAGAQHDVADSGELAEEPCPHAGQVADADAPQPNAAAATVSSRAPPAQQLEPAAARAQNASPAAAAASAAADRLALAAPADAGEEAAVGRLVWNHSTHVEGLVPLLAEWSSCCAPSPASPPPSLAASRADWRTARRLSLRILRRCARRSAASRVWRAWRARSRRCCW
jgi:hypothetical protein